VIGGCLTSKDVVAGIRTPLPIADLERENLKIYGQLVAAFSVDNMGSQ